MAAITRISSPPQKRRASKSAKDQEKSLAGLSHCQKNLLAKLVVSGVLSLRQEEASSEKVGASEEKLATTWLQVRSLSLVAEELGVSRQRLKSNLRELCRTGWLPSMAWIDEEGLEVCLGTTVLLYGELVACQQQLNHDLSVIERAAMEARLIELHQEIRSTLANDAARGREEERLLALEAGKEPLMREARSKLVRLAYEMAKGCKPGRLVMDVSKEVALVTAAALGFQPALVSDFAKAAEGDLHLPRVAMALSQEDESEVTGRGSKVAQVAQVPPSARAYEAPSGPVGPWEEQGGRQEDDAAASDESTSIFSQLPDPVSRDGSYWSTPTGKQEIQLRNEFYLLARSINPSYGPEVHKYYQRNPAIADLKAKTATLQRLARASR